MIRRVLHAELSDVRALASAAKRRAVSAWHHNVYLDLDPDRRSACAIVGPGGGVAGVGFTIGAPEQDLWPDGARLLTIGRVTLAAWGGRPS